MIRVSGLTKRYGAHTAVDAVDFRVEPGSVTGFLGLGRLRLLRCEPSGIAQLGVLRTNRAEAQMKGPWRA